MEQFSKASSYYHHLKSLYDQLSNVRALVSNERLILQLTSGLNDAYDTLGSQIHHNGTLPSFHKLSTLHDHLRRKRQSEKGSQHH